MAQMSESGASPSSSRISRNLQGAMWVLAASLFLAFTAAFVKLASQDHSLWQVLLCRFFFGGLAIAPIVIGRGNIPWRSHCFSLQFWRAVTLVGVVLCGTYGLRHLPLATGTALLFSRAIFLVGLSVLLLGEKPGRLRWTAAFIGLGGVVMLTKPFGGGFQWASLVALTGGFLQAVGTVQMKKILRHDDLRTALIYGNGLPLAFVVIPAALTWTAPDGSGWMFLIGLGVCGVTGQFLSFKGFRIGEASLLAPIDYTQIVFSTIIGYFVFATAVDIWTGLGASVIALAGMLIALDDWHTQRKARLAAVPFGEPKP